MPYVWAIDHDGTASKGDIGRDYLCGSCGLTPDSFFDEVYRIREDAGHRNEICREIGSAHEDGLELAMLLVLNRVPKKGVEKSGLESYNSMRDGFEEEFIHTTDKKIIVSAGPVDWLVGRYANMGGYNLEVIGTGLYTGQDGNYMRISQPCGRASKRGIVGDFAKSGSRIIAVGDSPGDEGMWACARESGGLAIGVGGMTKGLNIDLAVINGSWYPVWAAGEVWAASTGEKPSPEIPAAFDSECLDMIEYRTPLGREVFKRLAALKKRSEFSRSLIG